MLKRYSILAITIISVEIILLTLFRAPLKNAYRIPRTYQEVVLGKIKYSSSFISNLFASTIKLKDESTLSNPIKYSFLEKKLIEMGLVNIKSVDSSIVVDIRYATKNNFLHKNLYGDFKSCYLQKNIAKKLYIAQNKLKKRYPFYSLIIYDGVRPLSIQQTIWNELQIPEKNKNKYVSDPQIGSLHNYGCAIDVSIVNENGWEMDMGTPYDYFGELGHPIAESKMIKEGKLSWRQFENRKLLREVMTEAGFTIITTEWWHFNGTSLKNAKRLFEKIE
jgi:zinc D-Ala-D-Ala dipeptidase